MKSTCPCNFTLHYEIASRGNIVQSGQRHAKNIAHREKRATITFDTNIHTTAKPPQDTGQFYSNNCNEPLFNLLTYLRVFLQLWSFLALKITCTTMSFPSDLLIFIILTLFSVLCTVHILRIILLFAHDKT